MHRCVPQQFQAGFPGPGAFAQQVAPPHADHNLVALPETVNFKEAASLGCRFPTASRALAYTDQAALQPGEKVAIFGCGRVGLSAVMIASGALSPARIVTKCISLAALPAAMEAMGTFSGEAGITLVDCLED